MTLLFLCVANSARSQLAEGLARSLATAGVTVISAGSNPTSVRPAAVAVMDEIGIDITSHSSTLVDDVPPDTVDVVITLCAEEVCPAFLGSARRLHWPTPDPAGHDESGEARLQRFRDARDSIRDRLVAFLSEEGLLRAGQS